MDCKTARIMLMFSRPLGTELAADDVQALEGHLGDCSECGLLSRTEQAMDQQIASTMKSVPVPEGLRTRLLMRLEADRKPWYRRRPLQTSGAVAAAASIVLAMFLGLAWRSQQKITVQPEQIAARDFYKMANPSPDSVQDWFMQTMGIHTIAPTDFNYALLADYDLTDLEGVQVPRLLFSSGNNGQARVYILSQKKFNLPAALETPPGSGSGCKVDVRPHPTDPGVAYLVVYTGESVEPFLAAESRPAT